MCPCAGRDPNPSSPSALRHTGFSIPRNVGQASSQPSPVPSQAQQCRWPRCSLDPSIPSPCSEPVGCLPRAAQAPCVRQHPASALAWGSWRAALHSSGMETLTSFRGLTLHHHEGISLGPFAGSSKSIPAGSLIHVLFHTFLSTRPAGPAGNAAMRSHRKYLSLVHRPALTEGRSSLARKGLVLQSTALPRAPARAGSAQSALVNLGLGVPENSTSQAHPSGNSEEGAARPPPDTSVGLRASSAPLERSPWEGCGRGGALGSRWLCGGACPSPRREARARSAAFQGTRCPVKWEGPGPDRS